MKWMMRLMWELLIFLVLDKEMFDEFLSVTRVLCGLTVHEQSHLKCSNLTLSRYVSMIFGTRKRCSTFSGWLWEHFWIFCNVLVINMMITSYDQKLNSVLGVRWWVCNQHELPNKATKCDSILSIGKWNIYRDQNQELAIGTLQGAWADMIRQE